MRTLAIDLETFCELDIKKVGTYKYAENCEILLCAYAFDDDPVKVIDIANGEQFPKAFVQALFDADILKTAYNAPFEIQVLGKYFNKAMDTSQWACTMVLGLSLGLPAGLEQIGRVLGFAETKRKLATGTRLINFFSKPRTAQTLNYGLFGDILQNRNLPQHNPEKWKQFKEYCRQDVETERAVRDRLALFVLPESERKLWQLDQKINSNGVLIDMTLVDGALAIDSAIREDALLQGKNLTDGRNINSNTQMLDWIEDKEGWRPTSLDKESREELKGEKLTPEVQEFLQLKEVLAKTSVKKYQAMKDTVCSDGRARGMFQFYGANRTGRWAGRHIQLQNLPQNHLDDLDIARTYVRKADATALDLFYSNPSDVLSQLIRTAFIASEGCRFIVADFSAIEARVIAWLANEKWRMDVFASGGDIYCASASEMFKVPVEKHGVNKELRAKGKIAELACIAEGELVLTDKGLVPIEKVTFDHKLWDGEEWVSHEGVIFKGEKEVITYDGLTATPDHLVWVERESEPICFGIAATSGARLIQTGNGRTAIRLGKNHKRRKALEQKLESLLCVDSMHGLRINTMAEFWKFKKRQIKRLPEMFTAASNSYLVRQEVDCRKTALRESERQRISQLRRTRDKVLFPFNFSGRIVDYRKSGFAGTRYGIRPYRQQRQLRGRQFTFCFTHGKQFEQTFNRFDTFQSARVAVCLHGSDKEIITGDDERRNYSGRRKSSSRETQELAWYSRKVKVYDIRNAGKHHRFTVSGRLVHNCGYGGSVGALKNFGADKMGLTDSEMESIIKKWRESSPNICKLWRDVENAAKRAIKTAKKILLPNNIGFRLETDFLFIKLPSGREIAYYKPAVVEDDERDERECITYEGNIQAAGGWGTNRTWGGKLVENIVQATARDCLAAAMLRIDAAGYKIVMHVHDEIICEMPYGKGSLEEVISIMSKPLKWAKELLLTADGYETEYYKKD